MCDDALCTDKGDNYNVQPVRLALEHRWHGHNVHLAASAAQHRLPRMCCLYVSSYKQHSVMHIGSMSCGVSFMFLGTSCGTATLHAVPNSQDYIHWPASAALLLLC